MGDACADGEGFDAFCLMVLTRQLKLLNIDFIEVMPPAICTIDCEGT